MEQSSRPPLAPLVLSLAAATELKEIPEVTDAGRARELSFALSGTNSPVQRLPVEVLSEIFFACLPSLQYTPASRLLAPLVVSWVCAHWRNVAVSLPRLWSSLALQPNGPSGHLLYLSQSRFWLARTGRCQLSLSIHPRETSPHSFCHRGDPPQDYTSFLTVEGYIHRCTKIDIHIAISLGQFFHLLGKAFVLTDARFSGVYASAGDASCDHIELDNLHTLHIGASSELEAILSPLVLPQLLTLAVADVESRPSVWGELIRLFERSQCTLESLSYTTARSPRPSFGLPMGIANASHPAHPMHPIAGFLAHASVQGLRHLALRGFAVCHHTLAPLKLTASSQILPLLEKLDLTILCSFDGDMAAVVASRCAMAGSATASSPGGSSSGASATGRRLRSVTAQFDSASHKNDLARLNALGLGGLKLEMTQQQNWYDMQ
ncbi:hypothetical protein C8R43DRAFT_608650 [Mycena crocata]|nr:hypothetical protein C8R43DRAFT_608650 [Mycena crocata]